MLRITLSFEEPTWGDLRKFVALNHAAQDHEKLRFEYDEMSSENAILGLSEVIPSEEVVPRGE